MRKYILNIIIVFLIILLATSVFINIAQAETGFDAAKITKTTTAFDNNEKGKDFSNIASDISKNAIAIMRIVGVTIAIVMLLAVAMKYMVSSAGDRADIKKHAIVYVIGAMVLFGAVGILGVIDDFTKKSLQ